MLHFNPAVLAAVGFRALGRRFLTWRVCPPRKPGGKPIKLPCNGAWSAIDGTDEHNWLTFDRAVSIATRRKLGLGVALGWGLGGLDLDHCLDQTGTLSPSASLIVKHFKTFVEVSPSGTGVKAYFTTTRGFLSAKRDDRDVELYGGRRWFAMTGRPFGTLMPITDCTTNALLLGWTLRPPPPPRSPRPAGPPSTDALQRLRDCGTVRERPSIHGGTVVTLTRCPFTDEEHPGGGSFAILFPDGGIYFRCDRSAHGPQRQWVAP